MSGERYRAYGWHVMEVLDGEDTDAIANAIQTCKVSDKPSLIIVNTKIARYSPLEGSEKIARGAFGRGEYVRAQEKSFLAVGGSLCGAAGGL